MSSRPLRLAIVVSHPIQYYVPLYQRWARNEGVSLRVFFTWHAGDREVHDRGFGRRVKWDLPMTAGYEHELVPNVSREQGTHRILGLRNPDLLKRVTDWRPDVVHVTGWAGWSHFRLLRSLRSLRVPVLFRGDSHLLDGRGGALRWRLKRILLRRVYSWPSAFLVVGQANREYYRAFDVDERALYDCPHSIDVARFADSGPEFERQASGWRRELGISPDRRVLLFAGKFEAKKRPVELARAFLAGAEREHLLVMVGGGELESQLRSLAAADPERLILLPFQNQQRMPVVYRLGDLFVLPSAWGETWGLAVNEALASGRPVLVSDRAGCAADVVTESCGGLFPWQDLVVAIRRVNELFSTPERAEKLRAGAAEVAWRFDLGITESTTLEAANAVRRS